MDAERYSEDDLMPAVEAGAEDISSRGRHVRGGHRLADFAAVRRALEEAGIEIQSAELAYRPKSLVPIDERQTVEADEADRSARRPRRRVDEVYANFDAPPRSVLERASCQG